MQIKQRTLLRSIALLLCFLISGKQLLAVNDPVVTKPLLGSAGSVKVDSMSTTMDVNYFASLLPGYTGAAIQQTHSIKNLVSVGIEEESLTYAQTDFTVTVVLTITKYNTALQVIEEIDKTFNIEYKKAEGQKYKSIEYYPFENAAQVKVKLKPSPQA